MPLLPGVLHIRLNDKHAHLLRTTLQLMALETSEDGLGSSEIIGRLADVLFMQTLRAWCSAGGDGELDVGYQTDTALSRAFKRNDRPGSWRREHQPARVRELIVAGAGPTPVTSDRRGRAT